jgi:Glucokinase
LWIGTEGALLCIHSAASFSAQDAPSISKAALEDGDPLALEAVDMFLAIIGAEAGYMGLRLLASGGVYICGGIAPKVMRNRMWAGGSENPWLWVTVKMAKPRMGPIVESRKSFLGPVRGQRLVDAPESLIWELYQACRLNFTRPSILPAKPLPRWCRPWLRP